MPKRPVSPATLSECSMSSVPRAQAVSVPISEQEKKYMDPKTSEAIVMISEYSQTTSLKLGRLLKGNS